MREMPARSRVLSLTISRNRSLIARGSGVLIFSAARLTDAPDTKANCSIS